MKYFLLRDQDGDNYVRWAGEGVPPYPDGYPEPIELPRFPEPYERYDEASGTFLRDDHQRIDDEYRALRGADAIAQVRALKSLEATLILSGVTVEGLLHAEAEATGQSVEELAQIVADKAAEQRDAEVARIVAKRSA